MKASATFALAAAALLGSAGASAQYLWQAREAADAASKPAPKAAAVQQPAATGSGLMAFIDPVTGQLRAPEPDELQALNARIRANAKPDGPLAFITGPGGAVGVRLPESFDSFMVAQKNANGTLDFSCLPDENQAAAAIASPIPRVDINKLKAKFNEK